MAREARGLSGARHGVPLVAQPAGVETQRPIDAGGVRWCPGRRRHKARATVTVIERAVREEARLAPHERLQLLVRLIVERRAGADIEVAHTVVLESRQSGVLPEDVGDA